MLVENADQAPRRAFDPRSGHLVTVAVRSVHPIHGPNRDHGAEAIRETNWMAPSTRILIAVSPVISKRPATPWVPLLNSTNRLRTLSKSASMNSSRAGSYPPRRFRQ